MQLSENQKEDLEAIRNLPDESINTSDAPEVLDWSKAKRGGLYRPVKQQVTLTLDKYVMDWFEVVYSDPQKLHEAVNKVLMEHIRGREVPANKDKKAAANQE